MAKDLRGLFNNNRRREAMAVTGTVPYNIEPADLREGTAEVVLGNEAVTVLSIPDGILVTSVLMLVETGKEFAAGTTAAVDIGGTNVLTAITVAAPGIAVASTVPLLLEGTNDVVVTMAALTASPGAEVKIVINYTDYDRATMSYIGEE